jgi:predicted metallo-beta-lactamase superfamily hydrolase
MNDLEQTTLVKRSWFRGFCKRHMAEIVQKYGRNMIYVDRHFQLRAEHFKAMYERVYESMVQAGIAVKYVKPT